MFDANSATEIYKRKVLNILPLHLIAIFLVGFMVLNLVNYIIFEGFNSQCIIPVAITFVLISVATLMYLRIIIERYSVNVSNASPDIDHLFQNVNLPIFSIGDKDNIILSNNMFYKITGLKAGRIINILDDKTIKIHKKIYNVISLNINNFFYLKEVTSPTILNDIEFDKGNDIKYWYFFEHSPIAKVVINQDGTLYKSNSAFHKLIHIKLNKNWNLLSVIDKSNILEVEKLIKHTINKKNKTVEKFKPLEVRLRSSTDLVTLIYINVLEQYNGDSKLLVHLIDITEHKNLEMHLAHSQKMQAIGQLAGGIAHDFNNLLTAMLGFCDLLLIKHPAGDQSFVDIMQIKQNANRAANLVRQLLAFSKKQLMQPEILDITDIIDELSNLISRLIGEKIECKIHHGGELHLVKADQGQLEQVIINLAVNARDAMPDGGKLIIKTSNIFIDENENITQNLISPVEKEKIETGDYVCIEVQDTGCGISKDILNKIFEPFFSTKDVTDGTGLGLSTVYGIVKQTGGYIFLQTKKNHGTKFSIFLKSYTPSLELESITTTKKVTSIEEFSELSYSDLTGDSTILIVEDETPVRIFSIQALKNKGYKVLEAGSAEDALKMIDSGGNKIDMIITDVIMPGINGPEMIDKIKDLYPDIKVIFISGYAEDVFLQEKGYDEKKVNFLPKPFSLKQLVTKVKDVLSDNLVDVK